MHTCCQGGGDGYPGDRVPKWVGLAGNTISTDESFSLALSFLFTGAWVTWSLVTINKGRLSTQDVQFRFPVNTPLLCSQPTKLAQEAWLLVPTGLGTRGRPHPLSTPCPLSRPHSDQAIPTMPSCSDSWTPVPRRPHSEVRTCTRWSVF